MAELWRWLSAQTLRGLLLLVPVVVTIAAIVWLVRTLEASLRPLFEIFLPAGWYVPGLSVVLFLVLALLLGLLTRNVLLRTVLQVTERWVIRLPLIGSVYPVVRQLTDLFAGKNQGPGGSVVLVSFPELETRVIGLVTAPAEAVDVAGIPPEHDLVYIPMSYGIGGFMLILPRSRLQPLNIRPGEALQMIMMAGIARPKSGAEPR